MLSGDPRRFLIFVQPRARLMLRFFDTVWSYRGFITGSVKREFQARYQNSLLGATWAIINPLAMIIVYTLIFSQIMRAKLPEVDHRFAYSIYLCSGILTWGFFAEIVNRSQNMFLENANLLKKINFPRISLPIIVALNAGINFSIIFGLFLFFLLIAGLWPGWVGLAIIPALLLQTMLAIGLGVTLGVLNVFFRDVGQLFGIFIQFWFWFTPVVYPASILPPILENLMAINPMYPIISVYQGVFVSGSWPEWSSLFYPLILAIALCLFGARMFRKHSSEMVDEL
jgi:lipopolysaccharide transport system permease protein